MFELDHVSCGYGRKTVLHDVTLSFERGSLIGVIGPNGSGKSTLLKAALGFLSPREGRVLLGGEDVREIKRSTLAKELAYLSQSKSIPDMTVCQTVLCGRYPHLHYPRRYSQRDIELAYAAMRRMEIEALADAPMASLSGGMRQNVYLAMALVQDAGYILLDEPTTYLDVAHQLTLMKHLKRLAASGHGIVAVMHDLPLAMTFSDRIVVMQEGRVVAGDTPQAILRSHIPEEIFGVSLCQHPDMGSIGYRYEP